MHAMIQILVQSMKRRGLSGEQIQATKEKYHLFQAEHMKTLENDRTLFDWASKQTYIALANMLTGAALIGMSSCPIEGFSYEKVNQILTDAGVFRFRRMGSFGNGNFRLPSKRN